MLDVAYLQSTAPRKALFQLASQFNALESPSPEYLARPAEYIHDNTQGPRAAVSAFGATLLRHYSAPAGKTRFEQRTDKRQINLLSSVMPSSLAEIENGYLLPSNIHRAGELLIRLQDNFDKIKVGYHDNVSVTFGADWFGPVRTQYKIDQVFTSSIAGGQYGSLGHGSLRDIASVLLAAAYRGTLLAAAKNNQEFVVLTLIGGGVFGNPMGLITSAIRDAFRIAAAQSKNGMTVIVNARDGLPPGAVKMAKDLNGACFAVSPQGKARLVR